MILGVDQVQQTLYLERDHSPDSVYSPGLETAARKTLSASEFTRDHYLL